MSQGYLTRNVFERLYTTQTCASSRKHETASTDISKLSTKSKNQAQIDPNSRLFAGTEASKHKHDDQAGYILPSQSVSTRRQKRVVTAPVVRRLPQKSAIELTKTPVRKMPKASPPKSAPRTNDKTLSASPDDSFAPRTPATARPSTPNTVQSTPSQSSVHGDARLPSLEDLVDMIEIPIDEKVLTLFSDIGGTDDDKSVVELSEIVCVMEECFPELCTAAALQSYEKRPDSHTDSLDLADFKYFLLFLVYFHILYDDFVFFDDDDLRISKGEFEPIAQRLSLFEDLDAAYAEMEEGHEGYIMFDSLCAKCAQMKQS